MLFRSNTKIERVNPEQIDETIMEEAGRLIAEGGPREGSEREPETLCLQTVEPLYMRNRVLFVERSGELHDLARLST